MNDTVFRVGDRVRAEMDDYIIEGEVRGVVWKRNGVIRFVIEDGRGVLFVHQRRDLVLIKRP